MGRAYEVRKASIQKTGAARGKIYTTYAKELYLAAKKGIPDPDVNIVLKRLIDKAKKAQVPMDIINRAIDKAKGAGQEEYSAVTYEGFGPGAATLIISCLTDNVNRTVGLVRAAFNKVHKNLGVTNSVSYNYDYLAVVSFKCDNDDEVLNELIECGIEPIDFESEDGVLTISVNPSDENKLKDAIEKVISNVEYLFDEVGMFAKDKVKLNEEDMKAFELLLSLLDDIEDVSNVYHNVEM